MRTHVELGYSNVSQMPGLALAAEVVSSHEERFDGTGFPRGLKGDDILLRARLFAVIYSLNAIITDRSYCHGLGFEAAKENIFRYVRQSI